MPPKDRLTDGIVVLRPFDERDLPAIEKSANDPEILEWFGPPKGTAADFLAHKRRRWEDGTSASFAVCDTADDSRCLGYVFIEPGKYGRADVGYWLLREARGRGRATRAVRLASEWALRELRIARLQLRTDPENLPSQRVAERSGFVKEGTLRSFLEYKGGRSDAVFFSLLPTGYRQYLQSAGAGERDRAVDLAVIGQHVDVVAVEPPDDVPFETQNLRN